jgi:hypothetical protein
MNWAAALSGIGNALAGFQGARVEQQLRERAYEEQQARMKELATQTALEQRRVALAERAAAEDEAYRKRMEERQLAQSERERLTQGLDVAGRLGGAEIDPATARTLRGTYGDWIAPTPPGPTRLHEIAPPIEGVSADALMSGDYLKLAPFRVADLRSEATKQALAHALAQEKRDAAAEARAQTQHPLELDLTRAQAQLARSSAASQEALGEQRRALAGWHEARTDALDKNPELVNLGGSGGAGKEIATLIRTAYTTASKQVMDQQALSFTPLSPEEFNAKLKAAMIPQLSIVLSTYGAAFARDSKLRAMVDRTLQSLGIGTLPSTNETVYPDQQPGAVVPPAAVGGNPRGGAGSALRKPKPTGT